MPETPFTMPVFRHTSGPWVFADEDRFPHKPGEDWEIAGVANDPDDPGRLDLALKVYGYGAFPNVTPEDFDKVEIETAANARLARHAPDLLAEVCEARMIFEAIIQIRAKNARSIKNGPLGENSLEVLACRRIDALLGKIASSGEGEGGAP